MIRGARKHRIGQSTQCTPNRRNLESIAQPKQSPRVINNLVSGLILLFERPIKVGDVIQVGDAIGSVKKIGIRASIVHTQASSDVIVPNGTLISGEVINWTFSDRLRAISAQIQVPRGVDQRTATELLRQAASETSGLLKIRARKPISQI
jgi:potassium-dependent mechanosensitive channel